MFGASFIESFKVSKSTTLWSSWQFYEQQILRNFHWVSVLLSYFSPWISLGIFNWNFCVFWGEHIKAQSSNWGELYYLWRSASIVEESLGTSSYRPSHPGLQGSRCPGPWSVRSWTPYHLGPAVRLRAVPPLRGKSPRVTSTATVL